MKLQQAIYLFLISFSISTYAQYTNKQLNIVDILTYEFNIEINDQNNEISGNAAIQLRVLKKTDSIYLDLHNADKNGKGMHVESISAAEKNIYRYKHQNDKIIIYNTGDWHKLPSIWLFIQYKGVPKDGLYISKNKYGKRTFFGDNWPNRAHYWLPVIDHPSDKAKVQFSITAPKHYKVIATGKKLSMVTLDHKRIWHYYTNIPLSTKVMVFAAADFKIKEYGKVLLNETKIPISSWIYKQSPDKGFDDYRCAIRITQFYDSLIGPYSFEKLANVQSKTRFGGMENAGNIFYYEASVDGKKGVENLVAHEVAHQWFGNSVSEKNWSDIWLSEGFATYLTDVYLEFKYGKKRLKERMKMERKKVIRYNKYKAKPIVYDEKQNLMLLLNPNSYEKGAWVLHMLRQKTGDEQFFEILRAFYQKYHNKNATTSDFIKIVEQLTNSDYTKFFNQWLKYKGIPQLSISGKVDKEHRQLIVTVTQTNEKFYELPLKIEIKNKQNSEKFTLDIRQKQQQFILKLQGDFDENSEILIDPEIQLLFELTKLK